MLTRRRRVQVLVVAAAVVLAIGLVVVVGQGWLRPTASPEEVLVRAHLAANAGRYEDANQHLARSIREQPGLDLPSLWDQATQGGTIAGIDILEVTVRGESAAVRYRTRFTDGTSTETTTRMVKERGSWKESADLDAAG
jgi:hypothetical protein